MQSLAKYRAPTTNKSLGIEIECFVARNMETYKHYGFFYAGDDGSLVKDTYDVQGCEFVSQPLPQAWLKKEILKLGKRVGTWSVNKSCGIHIHVSRKWLSESKAKTIYAFLNTLPQDEQETFFGRTGNTYCRYGQPWNYGRYLPINAENKDTFEFRVFASGTPEWACYCVDMVVYLIENADHLNIDALYAFHDMHKAVI